MHRRSLSCLYAVLISIVALLLLAACTGRFNTNSLAPSLTATPVATVTATPVATVTATPTVQRATPTCVHLATPRPTTMLQPPQVFSSSLLSRAVQPQTYITDECQYLRERWNPENSVPGTVVVAVMFHDVFETGTYRPGDTFIPAKDLQEIAVTARLLGFQTITAVQLADFLEHNGRIPRRSMIWIVDDRHPDAVEKYFLPIADDNGWTITLGWPIGDTDRRQGLWKRMEDMNATGCLDVQSHGYAHLYMTDDMPDEVIRQELSAAMPVLEKHFGQRPVALVWPGGNFTSRAAQIAREVGYRIAFTAFSRGPLMYNWIPLGEQEWAIGDPLMVLPRFWGRPGLAEHLQDAADLSDAAAAQALQDYPQEADYYRAVCGCELPVPSYSR